MPLTPNTRAAVKKYGRLECVIAFNMHAQGYGASGIAQEGPVPIRTTRQADAAINAGRELVEDINSRRSTMALNSEIPSLKDAVVGQRVGVDYIPQPWEDKGTSAPFRSVTITHISKSGQLFICDERATDLMKNWRYGFDPVTGLAAYSGYKTMRLRYASPQEIAEDARWDRITADREAEFAEAARVQERAPDMEKALEEILRMARTPLNDRETDGSKMWRADVATLAANALGH